MQKILAYFIVLVFAARVATAQTLPQDAQTNKVSYQEIIETLRDSKDKLFGKAKKWITTQNSTANPYTVSFENEKDGAVTAKGSFTLPGDRRKYTVSFALSIGTKDGKYRYDFTDIQIQYTSPAGSSGGGFSYWGGSSYHEAERLEYPIETFYPIRLEHRRKPAIKWYEEINKSSFEAIDQQFKSLASSLKNAMQEKTGW